MAEEFSNDPLSERLTSFIQELDPGVQGELSSRLEAEPEECLALLRGLRVAQSEGYRATGWLGDSLRLEHPDRSPIALLGMAFDRPMVPKGAKADVDRLMESLDATFQGRQYAVYLRRPVPKDLDPAPVHKAVHLWLAAIDRGDWQGRHAIYEDDDVALELTLVKQPVDARGHCVLQVGPLTALESLASVDTEVVAASAQHRLDHPDVPLIIVLSSLFPWRLPRGFVQQLLYGTAKQIETALGPEGTTYRAQFESSDRALFSDAACATLGALWWVEGHGEEPLGFQVACNDNPWVDATLPEPEITRFRVADRSGDVKTLSWIERPRTWDLSA